MNKLIKTCSIIVAVALLLWGTAEVELAWAQWPPFDFRLTPSYENGRLTYRVTRLTSEVDWPINNISLKIPLPSGVRFVEAATLPSIRTDFDGREVSFLFPKLDESVENAYFVVEIIEPTQTVFTLQPWLSWEGQFPGDYLAEPITLDITQPQAADWQATDHLSLEVKASATVANQVITYKLYPRRITRDRMWDLRINLPLPEGTTLLSAAAPPSFETDFDGREVHFFSLEPPAIMEPLIINLSADGVTTPVLTTRAWASWKNVSRWTVKTIGAESQMVTSDIVVQPQAAQDVVVDQAGDIPFSDYDLTGVSIQTSETLLEVTFFTAGQVCSSQQPLEFRLFIDADCRADTGEARRGLGADYDIRYDLARDKVWVGVWDAETSKWPSAEAAVNHFVGRQAVTVQVPYSALGNNRQFCWAARGRNQSELFVPSPPDDWLPDSDDAGLTYSEPVSPAPASLVSPIGQATTKLVATPWAACTITRQPASPPSTSVAATTTALDNSSSTPPIYSRGRIAVPLYSSVGGYNIHLFSIPEGREIAQISNARQPNFWADGQRLLFKRPGENSGIYEYNFADGTEKLVSERPNYQYPFYDPWGSRLVYDNRDLPVGAGGISHSSLLIQCSLIPPSREIDQLCRNISQSGILLSAGPTGAIRGSHPVWTLTDMIAYSGCNSEAGVSRCGIYTVPSTSAARFSDGFAPRLLTDHPTDIPSDTKGNLIAFSSQREGNWEAYIVNLDGTGLRNRSKSSTSQDGLPTISPDGYWVAFVSNREGSPAVWATSIEGGQTQKLFDLPADQRVGMNDQDWLNERLTWGP